MISVIIWLYFFFKKWSLQFSKRSHIIMQTLLTVNVLKNVGWKQIASFYSSKQIHWLAFDLSSSAFTSASFYGLNVSLVLRWEQLPVALFHAIHNAMIYSLFYQSDKRFIHSILVFLVFHFAFNISNSVE